MSRRVPPASTEDVTPEIIRARDSDIPLDVFPSGFLELYEVLSYRNALHILYRACGEEFDQIVKALMDFRIDTMDMVRPGGNKSKVAIKMERLLHPLGWTETSIEADLDITRVSHVARTRKKKTTKLYRIPGFVAGHKIDFVKGRVAFDMEWNSKDQTFDRDINAVRALYECNIVAAGVLLTRSADLVPLFREIQSRVDIKDFKSKYGASTTWMGKLTSRLDAGRAGGAPILALGIRRSVVSDFDTWKAEHPPKRDAVFSIDQPVGGDDVC